jgi:putative hydrolase of the HAD superfamily
MVLIFDLDDTLCSERTYVESGLRAVARFGQQSFGWNPRTSFRFMLNTLESRGRGAIFNEWLATHDRNQKGLVDQCVRVYRNHTPRIRLNPEAQRLLPNLRNYPLYVVTDGHKVAQQRKVEALQLRRWFHNVLLTHRYGLQHAKPSTYCFNLIRVKERREWSDLVYIADNPAKDFVNLNQVGVATVRVLTGMHQDVRAKKGFDARYTIPNLSHLMKLLSLK